MFYIYTYTHKESGKIYVGQSVNIKRRYIEHKCNKNKSSYIDMAIKKHGINNFIFNVIEEWNTQEEANIAEIYAISYYDCLAPYGYNIALGGSASPKNPESIRKGAETRKRNKSVAGINNPAAKINQEIANEIRRLYNMGNISQHKLAAQFNIGRNIVQRVVYNETWVQ